MNNNFSFIRELNRLRWIVLPLFVFVLLFSLSFVFLSSPWQQRFSASPLLVTIGNTYYVAKTGSDSNSCAQATNQATSKLTIKNGIGCLAAGDTLVLRGGTYDGQAEPIQGVSGTSWSNAITVKGYSGETVIISNGWTVTGQYIIVDNIINEGPSAFWIYGDHVRVQNSEIRNHDSQGIIGCGGGYCEFINLHIHHIAWTQNNVMTCPVNALTNGFGYCHGLYLGHSNNNLIDGGEYDHISGFCVHPNPGDGWTIKNMKCHDAGAFLTNGTGYLVYNNISYNHYNPATGLPTDYTMVSYGDGNKYFNNTLVGNIYFNGINNTIKNNIVTGSIQQNSGPNTLSNNLTTNPLFVNATANNFHLQSTSPAINTGANLSPTVVNDFDGITRPQGSAYDIGAYEYVSGATIPNAPSSLSASAISSSQINLTWQDNSTNETSFKLERATSAAGPFSQIATPGSNTTSYSDSGLAPSTTYYYRVRASNSAGDSSYSNTANATTQASTGSGPVAWYKLDETSGITAADSSGNTNAGNLVNGPVWTTGKINGALSFNGTNQYMTTPSSASLNTIASQMSVALWIYKKAATPLNAYGTMIGRRFGTGNGDLWSLGYSNNATNDYTFGIKGGTTDFATPIGISSAGDLNTWVHLVGVYNGTTIILYKNGVQVLSAPASGAMLSETSPLVIGAGDNGTNGISEFVNANLDDTSIYNRALSAAEVLALYNAAPSSFDFSLATPANVSVVQGSSVSNPITATLVSSGTSQSVSFTTSGIPTGATYSYSPTSCNPTCPTTLTINSGTAAQGTYTITVIGTAGTLTHTTSFTLTVSPLASGTTYYVAKTGSDSNSCAQAQSLSTPKLTINGGLSCLASGDTLIIRAGNYLEDVSMSGTHSGVSWSSPTTVKAETPGTVTLNHIVVGFSSSPASYMIFDGLIIDAQFIYNVAFEMNVGDHIRVQNTELKNALHHGAFGCSNCEFINLNVHQNGIKPDGTDTCFGAGLCHGIYANGDGIIIEGGQYHHNEGHGIHYYPGPKNSIIRNTKVYNNGTGIGVYWGGNNKIYNNLVYNNKGGIRVGTSNGFFWNNTVYNNPNWGIYVDQAPNALINNIAYQNGTGNIYNGNGAANTLSNNLTTDPLFVNSASNDFHLQSTSPAINAGVSTAPVVTTDFDGISRPQGSAYDIGAYEYVGATYPTPYPTPVVNLTNVTFTPLLQGRNTIPAGTSFTLNFYTPGTTTLKATAIMSSDATGKLTFPSSVTLAAGNYDFLTATNGYLKKKQLNVALASNTTLALAQLTAGDLNTDNIVNSLDWSVMNAQWFSNNVQSDINGDGIVNSLDFSYLNSNWNKVGD